MSSVGTRVAESLFRISGDGNVTIAVAPSRSDFLRMHRRNSKSVETAERPVAQRRALLTGKIQLDKLELFRTTSVD